MRRNVTRYSLKKATEHIFYEAWMFYQTLALLTSPRQQLEVNIFLDAFAIHTRNLFDFFYPKKHSKPDDILVFDYIKNRKTFNMHKTKKKDLIFIVRKADKQVSHLTYARNRYNSKTKPWQYINIGRKIHQTLNSFYICLPDSFKNWPYIVKLKEVIDVYSRI